jgi:acyl-CoA thioesterase FadM
MGDVDAARIIYFAAPQHWQEAVFTGWLAALGRPLSALLDEGCAVPVVSCTTDFLVPLVLDDRIRLELWTQHVGRTSFGVRCDVTRPRDGLLCVRLTTRHVWARMGGAGDEERVRAQDLPGWLRAALEQAGPTEGAA